jgi:DNA gyrase subunit B
VVGSDLMALLEHAQSAVAALAGFPRHYPRFLLEQTAIAGAMNAEVLDDPTKRQEAAETIALRLDQLSDETERGWHGEPTEDGGLRFWRDVRGVREAVAIDRALIGSADARKLDRMAEELRTTYLKSGTLKRKDESFEVRSPTELLNAIFEWGRKGISMQRYKGLGEMNPSQLWETTLDDNARTLLQVKVEHADEADDLFAKLMGDVVEPRREFIQDNALSASIDA